MNDRAEIIQELCERYPGIRNRLAEMQRFAEQHSTISKEVVERHFTAASNVCRAVLHERWGEAATLSSAEREQRNSLEWRTLWYQAALSKITQHIESLLPDAPPAWPKIVFKAAMTLEMVIWQSTWSVGELNVLDDIIKPEQLSDSTPIHKPHSMVPPPFNEQTGLARIPTGAPMVGATYSLMSKWKENKAGYPCYRYTFGNHRDQQRYVETYIIDAESNVEEPVALQGSAAWEIVNRFGVMHAYTHLLLGAYAMQQPHPWKDTYEITGQALSDCLQLHKRRKDLTLNERMRLLLQLCRDVGQVGMDIYWPGTGRNFSLMQSRIWHMDFQHDGQRRLYDASTDLTNFTVFVASGAWANKFLNPEGSDKGTALFQYGILVEKILLLDPIRDERLVRLALHILFSARMRREPRLNYSVADILGVIFSEQEMERGNTDRQWRSQMTKKLYQVLADLKERLDFPITFPTTFPKQLMPDWADIRDVVEEGAGQLSMPRNYWPQLVEQTIDIGPPTEVAKELPAFKKALSTSTPTPAEIRAARETLGLSMSELAAKMELSKSWVQHVEAGRLKVQPGQLSRLRTILNL